MRVGLLRVCVFVRHQPSINVVLSLHQTEQIASKRDARHIRRCPSGRSGVAILSLDVMSLR